MSLLETALRSQFGQFWTPFERGLFVPRNSLQNLGFVLCRPEIRVFFDLRAHRALTFVEKTTKKKWLSTEHGDGQRFQQLADHGDAAMGPYYKNQGSIHREPGDIF